MRLSIPVLLFLVACCPAQQPATPDWGRLLDVGKVAEAETICSKMATSSDFAAKVEAQKCLANVALSKGGTIALVGNDQRGGTLGAGYTPEAADEALKHLDEGIRLAPQDLSLHEGRLHVLEVTGRFDQMAKALDESAMIYKGPDALQAWLAYDEELANDGQAKAGLQLTLVLNRHYPNSHDVLGNLGAFYNMLHQWKEGLPYIKQAVALAPDDAIDTWNLGWSYNHLDETSEADKWMAKSLSLDPTGKSLLDSRCLYAEFVETKLKDRTRACTLEKQNCEAERQTACATKAGLKPAASILNRP